MTPMGVMKVVRKNKIKYLKLVFFHRTAMP